MRYPVALFQRAGDLGGKRPTKRPTSGTTSFAKGGFAIFDDFDGPWDWDNFEACMASGSCQEATSSASSSKTRCSRVFFTSRLWKCRASLWRLRCAHVLGHFETMPSRLIVVANFNNDIGDYWEWSDHGYYPIELSNEGYKFGSQLRHLFPDALTH